MLTSAYRVLNAAGQLQFFREQALCGEKPIEERRRVLKQALLGNGFKDNLIAVMKSLRQDRMALVMESTKEITPSEVIGLLNTLESLKKQLTEYWLSMGFDAVISPAGCLPAVPHKLSSELPTLNSHYLIYNILDFPAGVLPVRLVQQDDIKDAVDTGTHRESRIPKDRMTEFFRLAQMDSEGLPVGVQVAALPNRDELCLHVMETIEQSIGFNEMSLAFLF